MHEMLKSQRVATEIVEFQTDRPKRGRRGSPMIPRGTTLYAIKYAKGGYFTYAYQNLADAQASVANSEKHQTDNEFYYPWNVVMNIQDTLHVASRNKQ